MLCFFVGALSHEENAPCLLVVARGNLLNISFEGLFKQIAIVTHENIWKRQDTISFQAVNELWRGNRNASVKEYHIGGKLANPRKSREPSRSK